MNTLLNLPKIQQQEQPLQNQFLKPSSSKMQMAMFCGRYVLMQLSDITDPQAFVQLPTRQHKPFHPVGKPEYLAARNLKTEHMQVHMATDTLAKAN